MKKILLFLLVFSCVAVHAQRKPKIKGSREVIKVRENLLPFNSIALMDDIEITLEKSSQPGYVIEADDNLVDVFKIRVEDSTLIISSFYKVTRKRKLDIVVQFSSVQRISANDGFITSKDVITGDYVEISLQGPAKMEVDTRASFVQLNLKGDSSGDFNIDSDSLQVYAMDKSDLKLYTTGQEANLDLAENARVRLEGTTDLMRANLRDDADLKAEKMEAGVVKAVLSGSSSAEINATSEFELDSSGSSKTELYGSPSITISAFRNTSVLSKRRD